MWAKVQRVGKVMRAKWSRDERGGSLSQESAEVSGGSSGGGGEMKIGRRKSGAFMHKLTGSSPETTNNGSMGKRGGERKEPVLGFPDFFK